MLNKKRILIFIDWFLPGTLAGGPIRSVANIVDQLDSGFEFRIITTNTDYNSIDAYEAITPNKWSTYNNYTKVYYFSRGFLSKKNVKKLISSTEHDYVYVNGIYSFYFSILPLLLSEKPKIIAARGMLSIQAFASNGAKKKSFLKAAKFLKLYKNCVFQVTSLEEMENIKTLLGGHTKTKLISNLPRKKDSVQILVPSKNKRNTFIYLARISPEKGQHYFLQALRNNSRPLLLDLYGPINDERYWRKCLQIIKSLPSHVEVQYKGTLNGVDVPTVIREYNFLALTSEGENFGHSIVEAMTEGLPVIISNRTPWLNLQQQKVGWDIEPNEILTLSKAIDEALALSGDEYTEFSNNSYNYITNHPMIESARKDYKSLFL